MAARIFLGFKGSCTSESRMACSLKTASTGMNGATPLVNLSRIGHSKSKSYKIKLLNSKLTLKTACSFMSSSDILSSGSGTKILLSKSLSYVLTNLLYCGWHALIFS